jgi:hypothetical protein
MAARRITTRHTARVRVDYTNTGPAPVTLGLTQKQGHLSVGKLGNPSDPGLLLVPPPVGKSLTRVAPDCWRPNEEISHPIVVTGTEVAPDETLTLRYEVWASKAAEPPTAYIQNREYTF